MKKKNKTIEYEPIEIYEVSHEEFLENLEAHKRRYDIKAKRINGIKSFFACMFFSPLEIVFKLLSIVSKLVAVISSLILPYGAYLAYRTYEEMHSGVQFTMTENGKNAVILLPFPFIAFALFYISDKLSDWFRLHK